LGLAVDQHSAVPLSPCNLSRTFFTGTVMQTKTQRRISVSQLSTFRWRFDEDVLRFSNYGFESLGIWRRKLEDFGSPEAIDLLYDHKMSVSSVHGAGGFTGDGVSLKEAIDDAISAIQLASRVDAGCLILHPGPRNGHTNSHAKRLLTTALNELMPAAADYGVQLALEPMSFKAAGRWTFFRRFDETLELLSQFPSRYLGLVLDLFAIQFDRKVFQSLTSFADRISLVQLADRSSEQPETRLSLGQGDAPVANWLVELQNCGYAKQYELEVHGSFNDELEYFKLLDQAQLFFDNQNV